MEYVNKQKQKSEFFMEDTFNNKYSQMLRLNSYASDNDQKESPQKQKKLSELQEQEKNNKLEEKQTRIKILDSFQKSYLLDRKKSNISQYSINMQSSINQHRPGSILHDHGSRSRSRSPINEESFSQNKSITSNKLPNNKILHQNNKSNIKKSDNIKTSLSKKKNEKSNIKKATSQQIRQIKRQIEQQEFLIQLEQNVHKHLTQLLKLKQNGKKITKQKTNQNIFKLYDQIGEYMNQTQNYVSSIKKLQKFVQ